MKYLNQLIGGLGVLLLLIAGLLYIGEVLFLNRAEMTTGSVVDLYRSIGDEGGNSYCPVFEFTSRDGQVVSFRGNVCSSPPAYAVGDQVELYYDPQNPEHVQMNNFWSKYVGVFVLAVIGLPFCLYGLWGLLTGRPK